MSAGIAFEATLLGVFAADLLGVAWLLRTLSLHPAPVVRRLSLRGRARALLLADRRRERILRSWRELLQRQGAARILPFLALGAGIFAPYLLGFLPHPSGTFASPQKSTDFLQTVWQVIAGALGLSVAMVAFAFEAFVSTGQRRLGGTLREFARQTRLLAVIQLGVLALLIDGTVLLGIGYEAPGGWAALWATLLSAATLLGVPFVLHRVVRALDPDELIRMRRERLEETVDEAMTHQLTGQAGDLVLQEYRPILIERSWIKPGNEIALTAGRDGELWDVRLGALTRLMMRLRRQGRAFRISLLVGLGDLVSVDTEVLAMPAQARASDRRRALRALKIGGARDASPPDRHLADQLSLLHGQAMRAVREGAVEEWRSIGELYRLVLLALPRTAAKLGVPFKGAVAAPGVFGFGPAQRISGHLGDELEAALATGDRELVEAISYQPAMIGREAVKLDALALATEMLGLYPAMYWMAKRSAESTASPLLLKRSTRSLMDCSHLVEQPFEEPTSTATERERGAAFGRVLFSQVNSILKAAIDLADSKTFADLERRWAKMLEYELAFVVGEPEPGQEPLSSLGDYRAVLQLGLAMWSAHLLAAAPAGAELEADGRVEALRVLASRFPDAEGLLDVYELANEREERERGVPWTGWFLSELPEEEAHTIGTSSELIFTAMLLLVSLMPAEDGVLELKPRPWFEYRRQEIDDAIERLREGAERWSAVFGVRAEGDAPTDRREPRAEWLARVERLEAVLTRSREGAAEYRKAELREAELDPAHVAEFRHDLLEATRKGRLIHDLFEAQGALRREKRDPEAERMVSRTWIPKSLFVRDSTVLGGDHVARELARATRLGEAQGLLDALGTAEPQGTDQELIVHLRDRVARMAKTSTPPTLLLLPISWRLRQNLGLGMAMRQQIESELVPVARQGEFGGLFESVPVLDSPHVPKDRLWLLNLPSVATFVEWPSEEDTGIDLELRSFDPREALEFLRENPEVRPQGASDERAIEAMQEQVFCEQYFHWRIEPGEAPVADCIRVPEELQH